MKNEQEALDIVGDTILKGFQNISTLKNREWFRTWITRVLINVANDKKKNCVLCGFFRGTYIIQSRRS